MALQGIRELILRLIGDDKSLNDMYRRQSAATKRFAAETKAATDKAGDSWDGFGVKAKRAQGIGIFRFSAGGVLPLTAGLIAAGQASRELAAQLEVTGAAASSTEGRLRNVGSQLLSGNIVGAFKAANAEIELTNEELEKLAQSGVSIDDLGAAKAEVAAAGFAKFADQLDRVQDSLIAANAAAAQFNVIPGLRPDEGTRGLPPQQPATILPELFSGLSPRAREALLDAQIAAKDATDEAIIRALRLQEKELRDLLKGTLTPNERLDVKEALSGVTSAIDGYYDAVQAQADQAAAAAEAARQEAIRAAAEAKRRRQAALAARAAARNAAQFTALGLTREGDERAPGVRTLRAQVRQIREDLEGTPLDTVKTDRVLDQIQKVLSGKLGVIGREVRLKIREMLQGIRDELEDFDNRPLTKTTSLNPDKILAGLGLSPEEIRALRGRLSGFNSAGKGLASGGTVGAFGIPVSATTGQPIQLTSVVQIDGREVGRATTVYQRDVGERNGTQKRG